MKVLGLISGGKDSCYNLSLCQQHGHEIVALGNLCPHPSTQQEDLDSWMFQTVGHELLESFSSCMGLPLYRAHITGSSVHVALSYTQTEGDEVEDLFRLVAYVQEQIPDLEAVACGAIASDYQRLRVENVCARLKLTSLCFLWRQPQLALLDGMIRDHLVAILVKVAVMGLDPDQDLGRTLEEAREKLLTLNDEFGVNLCGEGGEYETLVLDCSLFLFASIKIDQGEVIKDPTGNQTDLVGIYKPSHFHLEAKDSSVSIPAAKIFLVPEEICKKVQLSGNQTESYEVEVVVESCAEFVRVLLRPKEDGEIQQVARSGLSAVKAALKAHGSSIEEILAVNIYVRDMSQFALFNEVYAEVIPQVNPPSRACVQLEIPSIPFQLDLVGLRGGKAESKQVVHVQSRSSWAMCCVGPYGQATSVGNLTFLSGVIGMIPEKLSFENLSLKEEMEFCLKHVQAIAVATACDLKSSALKLNVYFQQEIFHELVSHLKQEFEALLETYLPAHVWWRGRKILEKTKPQKTRDSYLNVQEFDFQISPLISFIGVPALPKGARIEIVTLLMNGKAISSKEAALQQLPCPPVPAGAFLKSSIKSTMLNLRISCAMIQIQTREDSIKPMARIMDCAGYFALLQVVFPVIPDSFAHNLLPQLAEDCAQFLHQWLQDSDHHKEEVLALQMWYTLPSSFALLMNINEKLGWKEGNVLPAAGLGADLSLAASGIIEIMFSSKLI